MCAIDCKILLHDFQLQHFVVLISLPCGLGLHVRQCLYDVHALDHKMLFTESRSGLKCTFTTDMFRHKSFNYSRCRHTLVSTLWTTFNLYLKGYLLFGSLNILNYIESIWNGIFSWMDVISNWKKDRNFSVFQHVNLKRVKEYLFILFWQKWLYKNILVPK